MTAEIRKGSVGTSRQAGFRKQSNAGDMNAVAQSLFSFLDPNSVLPTRKKLPNAESQRIITCMDEALRKVDIVFMLPSLVKNPRGYEAVLPPQVILMLNEHKGLLDDLQLIHSNPTASSEDGGGNGGDNTALRDLRELINTSTRNIIRVLSNDQGALAEIRGRATPLTPPQLLLIEKLGELKTVFFEKLLTTVEEEKERSEYLTHIVSREKKSSMEVQKLEAHLAEAKRERNKEVSKRNEVIRNLKEQLSEIKTSMSDSAKRIDAESKTRTEADRASFVSVSERLTADINRVRQLYEDETREHREQELALRKRKFKIETEVENWINKYDVEMGEKQDELEDLQLVHEEEKMQLDELQKQYDKLKIQYDAILEEMRIENERRAVAEKEMTILINSAVLIQAVWRGFKARRAFKQKGKKGGREASSKKKKR